MYMCKEENREQEENPGIVNEPIAEYQRRYQTSEEKDSIPPELIASAFNLAKQSVKEGRVYTTQQVMNSIDKEMGWK